MSSDNVLPMSLEYSVTYVPERFKNTRRAKLKLLVLPIFCIENIRNEPLATDLD